MGLISHWRLNGNGKDALGRFDGIVHGTPAWTQGILGECYDNTAGNVNTGVELLQNADADKYDHTFAWSFWIMATTDTGDTIARILSRDLSEYGGLTIDQSVSPNVLRENNASVELDTWYHVVMNVTNHNEVDWYVASSFVTSAVEAYKPDSVRPWVIGGNTEGDGDISGNEFVGKIADVRFFNHRLSQHEINELARAKVAHWKFNEVMEPTENLVPKAERYAEGEREYSGTGYSIYQQVFPFSDYDIADGDPISFSFEGRIDQARQDAGGRIRFYIWTYNSVDGWMRSVDKPITSIYYQYGGITLYRDDAADITASSNDSPADGFKIGIYYHPQDNDTGTVWYRRLQAELKDHATPFTDTIREGRVLDSSGQGNHGLMKGAPRIIDGKIGRQALLFDGIGDDINLPNVLSLKPKKELTVSLRFNIDAVDTGERQVLLLVGRDTNSGYGVWEQNGLIRIRLIGNNVASFSISANTPYHLVFNYKSGVGGNLYINKVNVSAIGDYGDLTYSEMYGDSPTIGSHGGIYYYGGMIDDVRIYVRSISEQAIEDIHQTLTRVANNHRVFTQELLEPQSLTIFKNKLYHISDDGNNIIRTLDANDLETVDVSDFVESDDTLGNTLVTMSIYVTSTDYVLHRFEYTKINNDEGFSVGNLTPAHGWRVGWNYLSFLVSNYQNATLTPWSNMDRIQLYRTGPTTDADTSQFIAFGEVQFKKLSDNAVIENRLLDNGALTSKNLSEKGLYPPADYLDYNEWVVGTTGSQGAFNTTGDESESAIVIRPDPWGFYVPVWQSIPDGNDNADGGWNVNFTGNNSQRLRFTVFFKRTGGFDGQTYLGCDNRDNTLNLDGSINGNPYFWSGDPPELDTWYLIVGILHPNGYTGGGYDVAGVYDLDGKKVLDGGEYKWGTGTGQRHRAYLFYTLDTTIRQYFVYPRVDILDGTEPSIEELLNGVEHLVGEDRGLSMLHDEGSIHALEFNEVDL